MLNGENMIIFALGDVHGEWGRLNTFINKKEPDIIFQWVILLFSGNLFMIIMLEKLKITILKFIGALEIMKI
jgi:hypothetical protein